MSNFITVEYCKCDDCIHNKICMYKKSLTDVFSKLMTDIGEDKFSDEAPFVLNIDCRFKTVNKPTPKLAPVQNPNINQVIYQPNQTMSDFDKVARDPKSAIPNMNTLYKEPIQTPPSNIRTIQNGVVTEEGKPKNKKLTTEEKVEMMKNYASNQFIPNQDKINNQNDINSNNNIPIQTPAEATGTSVGE